MIQGVWEFVVKEEALSQFERAYGPGGPWSKLFARYPGFRGTTLLRDTKRPRRYLTIDLWETNDQREQMLAQGKAEYSEMDAVFGNWTDTEAEVGVFDVLSEPTLKEHVAGERPSNEPSTRRMK
jgi:hypothetical protein